MKEGRLTNRIAVITGGARGIGKATALKMVKEGAAVALLDLLSSDLEKTLQEIKSQGGKVLGLPADISSRAQVEQAFSVINAEWGRIDILVNNAGVVYPAPLDKVQDDDWDKVVSVNLKGTFFCTRAALPGMKKNRYGKIINIGSRASLGKEERTVYSATKAGLIGLTRTWALELAPYNINVNYVGPGPIATELFKASNPPDSPRTQAIIRSIPLQRMGEPADVANLISFLASDEASFITGQVIFICGGLTVGAVHY